MSDLTQSERDELEALRREKALTVKSGLSMKVSEKGALSLYGLGRFPVTLYKEQWVKVLDYADAIRSFLKENDSKLKAKS